MAAAAEDEVVRLSLGFAEDVDLPGWVFLPHDLTDEEQHLFISEVTRMLQELMQESTQQPPPSEEQLHHLLRAGLEARAESDSSVMYQVWPVAGPAALLCHVNFVRTADLPDWTQLPGVVHAADARHIGPGLQYSARRRIEDENGEPIEMSAVHFVFTDEEQGLMVGLHESPSVLVSQALVSFGLFKNSLTLSREDGSAFTSVAPAGLIADDEWRAAEDGES